MPSPLPTVAISILQPWAWFIVNGFKDVENRTWPMPAKYEGEWVLIQASARPGFDLGEVEDILLSTLPSQLVSDRLPEAGRGVGGIVGMARFGTPGHGHPSLWANREPGIWHWPVIETQALPFMPFKGRLGFFPCTYTEAREATCQA